MKLSEANDIAFKEGNEAGKERKRFMTRTTRFIGYGIVVIWFTTWIFRYVPQWKGLSSFQLVGFSGKPLTFGELSIPVILGIAAVLLLAIELLGIFLKKMKEKGKS